MPKKPPRGLAPGISKTKEGTYRVRMTHNGKRFSLGTFETLKIAKIARTRAQAEMAAGTFKRPSERRAEEAARAKAEERARVTVDDAYRDFITWSTRVGRAPGTIASHESRYNTHIRDTLGRLPITEVNTEDVERWYDSIRGDGARRNAYQTLSALFTWATGNARGQGHQFQPLIDESPVAISGALSHDKRTSETVLTDQQLTFIADRMPEGNKVAVLIAGWCGTRIGEVLALQRRDVLESSTGILWLRIDKQVQARGRGLYETAPKSKAGTRDVPVPPTIEQPLREHLENHVDKPLDSLLFPRRPGSREWIHPNTLRNQFNTAVQKWNDANHDDELTDVVFHSTRHAALTRYGNAGATITELMRIAGHATPEQVVRYQHATKDRLAMLAERVSQ